MIYCDTSLLVSILVAEVNSDLARSWYFAPGRPRCAISDWVILEVASALARKQRNGLLDARQRGVVEHAWSALQSELDDIAMRPKHFRIAAGLVDADPRGLRSGDALHLAIASEEGCQLATFDNDLAGAARAIGIVVYPA